MEKQDLLKKYPSEEDKLLVSKILDKIKMVDTKNYLACTDFLNLHEQIVAEQVLKIQSQESYFLFGGNSSSERRMLFLYPNKLTEEIALEHAKKFMAIIRIQLPKSNEEIYTHRDYLGLIMKVGVKREKIGDILVNDIGADIIVEKETTKFLLEELPKYTRFQKAKIEVVSINELKKSEQNFEEIKIIVPSYRLDSIVSEIIRISRTKAVDIIAEERVYVNFEVCLNRSKQLKIGDTISIRGKGRFKIAEELGKTKKENVVIKILKNI